MADTGHDALQTSETQSTGFAVYLDALLKSIIHNVYIFTADFVHYKLVANSKLHSAYATFNLIFMPEKGRQLYT